MSSKNFLTAAITVILLALCLMKINSSGTTAATLHATPIIDNNHHPSFKLSATLQLRIRVYYKNSNLNTNPMFLRGNIPPLSWSSGIPLQIVGSNNNGIFETLLNISQSDLKSNGYLLQMKSLVNDRDWQLGPNSMFDLKHLAQNNGIQPKHDDMPSSSRMTRGEDSMISLDLYPWFYTTEGSILVLPNPIYSPQLKNYRNITLYLPPSYFENSWKRYDNLLIMHDGQNLFDPSTAFMNQAWMIQNTLNPLMLNSNANYAMEEVVVIGVYNTADRMNEYTYSRDASVGAGGKGDLYLDFLEQTLMPTLMETFKRRWILDHSKLGILGSSLGGLISCYAGWTRPKVYGKVGCMSSSFWWNNQDFNNRILNRPNVPQQLVIYLDSGNQGVDNDDVVQTQTVRDHILSFPSFTFGKNLYYYLDNGGQHNEYFWGRRFWSPCLSLWKPVPQLVGGSSVQYKRN
ncbi:hypothetical protein C9374_010125 [Naegleria lovaniensis]|uniref:Esterase n=1 Tax=Naegleria lovaniensis TaxID=51637 RepID=A0AA88GJ55_NAELO|nr:uncharacterized protein C9374_010125 [Naegleria lovaniensis]KAG2375121.1 hypothetical protein C9374_010125 [Naegleria lovaniensis]